MTITQWFNSNDPYFECPYAAIHEAGFSSAELVAEYQRVFGSTWQARMVADQSAYYSTWQSRPYHSGFNSR